MRGGEGRVETALGDGGREGDVEGGVGDGPGGTGRGGEGQWGSSGRSKEIRTSLQPLSLLGVART